MGGYSAKPLIQKLDIKSGIRIVVINAPPGYWEALGELPDGASRVEPDHQPVDLIHLFVRERNALEASLPTLKEQIVASGAIWVSWPKRSSGAITDLDENAVREAALRTGLVDVKVCAIDDIWSGLKLVIRVQDRKR